MEAARMDIVEIEQRLQSYDWNEIMYDPLQDFIEADTDEEKLAVAGMEQLIDDVQQFYLQSPEQASLLMDKYWSDKPMEHWIERIKGEGSETYENLKTMKPQELNTTDYLVKGLEKEHVIANEVVNKAERESLTGGRFLAYNTDAYFLSSRQVHFFKESQAANTFVLEHPTKAYKIIEFDSVQDMLRKIPYGSIVAEQQEKYSRDLKNELVRDEKMLSGELLSKLQNAMANGESWIAYNGSLSDLSEIYFFSSKAEAEGFASDNISDRDQFSIKCVETIINNQKNEVMNEQNMQYLKDNIKYMGFGEGLHSELENQLKSGKTDFQLHFDGEMNKKPFEALLNFRKSDNSDMYFFNSYHAKLELTNGEQREQTFYLDKGKGVTAKEAFNLLEGRAVHKDLTNKSNEPYKAWLQLDFSARDKHNNFEVKQYHENYGYDLRAAVGKLSVSELGDPDKEKALLQSLQKGNIQSVSLDKDGSSVKMFIEANPQFKTVNVYDAAMKRVQKEDLVQYQSKQMVKEPEQTLKQESSQKKTAGKKDVKSEDSLLPKKRTSQKKGLGIA